MRLVYFTHSLSSCWNHGNAHFLRGVLDELACRGHEVCSFEPRHSWSLSNLLADHGSAGLEPFRRQYRRLNPAIYDPDTDLAPLIDDAALVIVHEWNDPALVSAIGALRRAGGRFLLLFHDTHHRAVSAPDELESYDLEYYDGVLAFGEALSEVYRRRGWANRVWTWHEAADLKRFRPPAQEGQREGLVWIGNWGDGERTAELEEFLFAPSRATGLPLNVFGVRYPPSALETLARYGANYKGWAPNADVPDVFARHLATVHVPRRYYARQLPGIPTIRMFEALACGIPLISAPWSDSEALFRPGTDYLTATDGSEMGRLLAMLCNEPALRLALAKSGLETIRSRHSCAHRVDQLFGIVSEISGADTRRVPA